MTTLTRIVSITALLLTFGGSARAQCDGPEWTTQDDGAYENGLGTTGLSRVSVAQLMNTESEPVVLKKVCVCFQTVDLDASLLGFDVIVWDSNGPGGAPGTILGELPNQLLISVPFGLEGKSKAVDVSSLGIETSRPFYVGTRWDPLLFRDYFACVDESSTTPRATAYFGTLIQGVFQWGLLDFSLEPDFRAFGIRAVTEQATAPLCTPDTNSLCLGTDGRFRVSVVFDDGSGDAPAVAREIDGVRDSGLFWFFNSSNLEILVKVLEACPVNNRIWTFFAATTNVKFVLKVEDLVAGVTKTYFNPPGETAMTITDTDSFATCAFGSTATKEYMEYSTPPNAKGLSSLKDALRQQR